MIAGDDPSAVPRLRNVEAEAALLGALMIDNRLVESVADIARAEDFFESLHADVFAAIVREQARGNRATPITLRPIFIDDPRMIELGGPGYLASLTGSGAGLIGAKDFAAQIADLARRRRLVAGLRTAIDSAADFDNDIADVIAATDAAIEEAAAHRDPIHQPSGADCLDEVIAQFDQPVAGVRCGKIPTLDRVLGPLAPGNLVIAGGRPGMGKTAVGISYALGAAERGHGVIIISLEMGSFELGQRMAADLCFDSDVDVPFEAIRDDRLTEIQRREIHWARERISRMPLRVIDKGALTLGQLGRIVQRWRRRFAASSTPLELVIVDYLQLLQPDTRGLNAYQAVSEVSRALKGLAKDQNLAVLALAQLSRDVEKRENKRPIQSDLRDSGQIEQDADAIVFLYRLAHYLLQAEPDAGSATYEAWRAALDEARDNLEFIVAKRRNGCPGTGHGCFHAAYQAVRA